VKQLIELSGQHLSIRAIARKLDISRNVVRKYMRAPGLQGSGVYVDGLRAPQRFEAADLPRAGEPR
jgi:hypothetical protein